MLRSLKRGSTLFPRSSTAKKRIREALMHNKTLAQLSLALHKKEISSVELTRHFLERIKKIDPSLNSFITVTEKEALAQALRADQRIASGEATPLTGIPIAHKDIFCTFGIK